MYYIIETLNLYSPRNTIQEISTFCYLQINIMLIFFRYDYKYFTLRNFSQNVYCVCCLVVYSWYNKKLGFLSGRAMTWVWEDFLTPMQEIQINAKHNDRIFNVLSQYFLSYLCIKQLAYLTTKCLQLNSVCRVKLRFLNFVFTLITQ